MRFSVSIAIFACLSSCFNAEAKHCDKPPIKVAVIDTGFGYADLGHDAQLCQYGHKDFSVDRQFTKNYATTDPIPVDINSHGTNIVGIIDSYLKKAHTNYCIVVIKFYSEQQSGTGNLIATVRAFNYATNIKADYINYSGGGQVESHIEKASVKRFLNSGGKLITAAGNESQNLDVPPNQYFPAMYDKRAIVVGNLCSDGIRCKSSNYGSVITRWEIGENVTAYGITMTGTSQATATATGKIVAESDNKCDIGR